jgi:uncharacterized protein (TIGR00369 family)
MTSQHFGNPDQALIQRFIEGGRRPLLIDSNPLATALQSTLLRVDREQGEVEMSFEPPALFIQGTGVLQGGVISAMLDFGMAFATLAKLPKSSSCASVNLTSSFIRPAPQGTYTVTGIVDRCGKTLAFTQARLVNVTTGALVATGTSALAVIA